MVMLKLKSNRRKTNMKKIENLTNAEIEKLVNNNDFSRILDDYKNDDLEITLSDILDTFYKCKCKYDFDYYYTGSNYFELINIDNVTSLALENFVNNYNLQEEEKQTIEKFYKAMDRFLNMSYYNKQYDNLENYLYNELKEINYIICNFINGIIEYYNTNEYFTDYVKNCYDNFYNYRYDVKNDKLYMLNDNYNKKWIEA